eukprot:1154231-Pelagomonas_calceolata.AAC.2
MNQNTFNYRTGTLFNQKHTASFKISTSQHCPLCGEPDRALHILLGCERFTMSNMVTERHNIASRILFKAISKGPLGAGLASMDIGNADRLALQNLQIPEHSTNRILPNYILPRHFPDKQRLTSSRPDAISVVPVKRVPRTNSRYLLRSKGGHWGNREHSAPATATPPTSKVRHPSQLHPEQRHVHLVEVKYCEDTLEQASSSATVMSWSPGQARGGRQQGGGPRIESLRLGWR